MKQIDPEYVLTIIDILSLHAKHTPEALAYSVEGEGITYGRLLEEMLQTAMALADSDLKEGDRCAIILPTGIDFIRLLYAIQSLGAAPTAINPGLSTELILRRIQVAGCKLAIATGSTLENLKTTASPGFSPPPVKSPEEVRCSSACAIPGHSRTDLAGTAFLQFTSGTTGDTKAAIITHKNLMAHLRVTADFMRIKEGDVFVGWLPLYHDLGLVQFIFAPLYSGCPCYLIQPSILNLPKWLETISRERGTITACPDFGYRIAARIVNPKGIDLNTLRIAKNGGEPVRLSSIEQFERRFGLSGVVRPAYGLAEATLSVTCLAPGEPLRTDARGNLSCGLPIGDTKIKIVDQKGKKLSPGETGEILIKGPQIFTGYFDDEKATKKSLKNGWLYTGDLGTLDSDGHLYIFGRKRALIKRAGAMLVPREIEDLADRVNGIRFSAAVGFSPGREETEEVVVIAEVRARHEKTIDDLDTITLNIMNEIKKGLGFPPFEIVLVSESTIPRTPNGKIQYDKLRLLYSSGALAQQGVILHGKAGKE
jgi:fatty-acyl-CoA synthase